VYQPTNSCDSCPWCRVDELEAIVATLPKCNRLVDGKIVCDKPVTPGMTIWYWLSDGEPGLPSENSMLISCKLHSFHRTTTLTEMDGWLQFQYCYDTLEAAEAARKGMPAG
jgi:hypothetical protein